MATLYKVRKAHEMVCATETVKVEPRNGSDFSLEELHEFIGGWIEIVRLDNEKIMVVDEEGKLKGLPFNVAATLEYNDRTGRHDDIILGNALVCGIGEVR